MAQNCFLLLVLHNMTISGRFDLIERCSTGFYAIVGTVRWLSDYLITININILTTNLLREILPRTMFYHSSLISYETFMSTHFMFF